MTTDRSIEPDTKDWTWVVEHPCPECGFDPNGQDVTDLPRAIRANAALWFALLGDPEVSRRPAGGVWSPLEYACHVRDVHKVFFDRVETVLTRVRPQFANWDQDETAILDRYADQDPNSVAPSLLRAAYAVADLYAAISDQDWHRQGFRSDGFEFTVRTMAWYHLHDVVHHLQDVQQAEKRITVKSYSDQARDYAADTMETTGPVREQLDRFARRLGSGARVLEIGTGGGRDAAVLEASGLSVRRTDIAAGFVDLLRSSGLPADLIDPSVDDLRDPARPGLYDGVWANACLLHVQAEEMAGVLDRLAEVTRQHGWLFMSVKEGDGAGWSTHGVIDGPRHFTYWQEAPLRACLDHAGWSVHDVERRVGNRGDTWLMVVAEHR